MKAREIDWSRAPEGADKYNKFNKRFYRGERPHLEVFDEQREVWRGSELNPQNENFVHRPHESSTWNGTGLPPAGCEIEYRSSSGRWRPGEYIGQFNGQMVIGCRETGVIGYCQSEIVRPIRTPEQIATEEALAEIERLYSEGGPAAVYDAGYRKVEGERQ